MANEFNDVITSDKWKYIGRCTCGGTMTMKYNNKADSTIKLRVKPTKNKFNVYSHKWAEWDKPISDMQAIFNQHNL